MNGVPDLISEVVLADRVRVAVGQEQLLKEASETVLLLDDYLVALQGYPDDIVLVWNGRVYLGDLQKDRLELTIWCNVEDFIALGAVLLPEVDTHDKGRCCSVLERKMSFVTIW